MGEARAALAEARSLEAVPPEQQTLVRCGREEQAVVLCLLAMHAIAYG